MAQAHNKNFLDQLENTLDQSFHKKAPALPQSWKELFVKIAPYLTILSVIVSIPSIFVLFGLGSLVTVLAPISDTKAVNELPTMWLSIVLLIPVVILEVLAIPGLFAKKHMGWKYMFWAQLISVVSNLVQFNIVGAIASFLIGFYILFQIRSLYK